MNNEKPTERKLRRIFKIGSESFFKRNRDSIGNTGMSDKRESLVGKEVCQTQRSKEMGEKYCLCDVRILYWCGHGKELDPSDNASYSACKPISDALVNLGFASDDKDFKTQAAQRMDKDKIDF